MSQKAIKGSAIAEFLTNRDLEDYESIKFDFSNENLMAVSHDSSKKDWLKLYFNEASKALGHIIGVVLITPKGEHCSFMIKLDFNYTNNVAEYEACMIHEYPHLA